MAAEEPVPVTPDVAPLRSAGGQCEPPTLPRLVPLLPKREALLRTFEALRVAQAKGSPPAHTLMALRLDRAESPTEEETSTPSVRRSLLARTESTSSSSADGDRKRPHSASEGEDADDDALSTPRGPCEGSPRQRKRPKTKWRKPTYLVRKEEKDVLLGQIRELEAQVQFLHRNVGAVDWQLHDRRLVEKEVHNNLMRESMRNQQLQLLTAQSALSELTHAVQCPIETFIRLGRDWSARRATLVAMKPQKLHDAVHLLDRRTQFLDDTMRECSESSQFLTDRGDLCVVRFDVVPLDGVHSIKDVFDASCGFLQRVQTDLSEEENTNVIHRCSGRDGDETILHRRVLMSSDHMATESNFVVFSELTQPRDQHQHQQEHPHQHHQHQAHASGLLVFDFVDEDELYPYRSQDYLRQDVSGAVRLSMRSRRRRNERGCLEDEPLVVLTRWVFITVHRGGFPIPTAAMQEVKQRIHRVGDEMIDSIRDSCASPKPSTPPTPVTPSMRPLPRLPSIRVPHYSPPPSMTEQL